MRATLRTLLVLGRVSNLPTVWSNCLAGWTLAGGLPLASAPLFLLCAGCSLLYTAGMYLNDACDVAFDTAHRAERPIPAGVIRRRTVALLGAGWLSAGSVTLLWVVPRGALWVAALAGLILLYDLLHKRISYAPVLMGGCRVLIYPLAGVAAGRYFSALETGRVAVPHGTPLWWSAAAMGAWILTVSILARTEARPGSFRRSASLLLLLPLAIGCGLHGWAALFPAVLLALWIVRCLLLLHRTGRVGAAVGDLLAGIPLVDLLAVSPAPGAAYVPYLGFMVLALLLRRSIPPT